MERSLAYAGLADSWALMPQFVRSVDPADAMERAESLAMRAIALNDALAEPPCDPGDPPLFPMFEDDFDAGTSADNWLLYTTSSDYTADFAFDYSFEGVPSAPSSTGGSRY